ncbi:MAG: tRNA (cytidine(34)-2'-O)-methyltransferase [Candidatus Ancillula sp.]|jgi:tRNA (cytidine/uridine-2'-O-)-methyltransferase|nr:tRNA (cytidine(34)-2'-O)-methyltransferase [Candidatus Ancillula sp.]
MTDLVFFEPCIPGNTGNAIRLSAVVGCTLHLIKPLGFNLDDKKLKRAGLDYHDLGHMVVHEDFDSFLDTVNSDVKIYAFTTHTDIHFNQVKYQQDDVLLFGPEPSGLPKHILDHPRITKSLRIPMQPDARSLNLAVAASIAVYEVWRQQDYKM